MTSPAPDPRAWPIEHHRGPATGFHARELPQPASRSVWWFEVTGPAVALGSTQPLGVIDAERAALAGVEVVRRRSGGGAVWLAPGEVAWVDVVLPAGDPLWVDDVGRAAGWLGRAWVDALGTLGVTGLVCHEGPMVHALHSRLVCFAGLAPGEITRGGRKVVGISQRRTRAGARFQCAVLLRWAPRPLLDVLALGAGERERLGAELADAGTGIGAITPAAVVAALADRLRTEPPA